MNSISSVSGAVMLDMRLKCIFFTSAGRGESRGTDKGTFGYRSKSLNSL